MAGKLELSGKLVPSPRNRINSNREISEASMAEFQDWTRSTLTSISVPHMESLWQTIYPHRTFKVSSLNAYEHWKCEGKNN